MGDYFDEAIPASVLQDIMDYQAEGAELVRKYPADLRGLLAAIDEVSASFYGAGHAVHAMMHGDFDFVERAGINRELVPDELSDMQIGMGEGYMRAHILLASLVKEFVDYYNEGKEAADGDV